MKLCICRKRCSFELICIARVLLQDRKIILLDEATANIDAETDAKIQEVLREFFKGIIYLQIVLREPLFKFEEKLF